MKTLTKAIKAYTIDELPQKAQNNAIENFKQSPFWQEQQNEMFNEEIKENLKTDFPNSDLQFQYWLNYCQGDGFNIYGELNLNDFIKKWEATEKEKKTIQFYAEYIGDYTFTRNNDCSFSCKYLDLKHINSVINELISELKFNDIKNIDEELIERFYTDMINYFSKLDLDYANYGYKYLYFDYQDANDEIFEQYLEDGSIFDENGNEIFENEWED